MFHLSHLLVQRETLRSLFGWVWLVCVGGFGFVLFGVSVSFALLLPSQTCRVSTLLNDLCTLHTWRPHSCKKKGVFLTKVSNNVWPVVFESVRAFGCGLKLVSLREFFALALAVSEKVIVSPSKTSNCAQTSGLSVGGCDSFAFTTKLPAASVLTRRGQLKMPPIETSRRAKIQTVKVFQFNVCL